MNIEKPLKVVIPDEKTVKKLSAIFPNVSKNSIRNFLIKTHNDMDETSLLIIEKGNDVSTLENENIESKESESEGS